MEPKKHKPQDVVGGLIIIGLLIWWVLPSGNKAESSQSSQPPTQEASSSIPREVYQVSASKLFHDYEQNELATQEGLKNKQVVVLGQIQSINLNAIGDIVIDLYTGNEFMPAVIGIQNTEKDKVMKLKRGDKIAVSCSSVTRIAGSPSASDCTITPSSSTATN